MLVNQITPSASMYRTIFAQASGGGNITIPYMTIPDQAQTDTCTDRGYDSIQVILEGFGFRLGPQEVLGTFLDLPYTLATQPEHLADLFQGFGFVIEAKAQAEDLLLTRRDLAREAR